ncbi:MAG: D-serine ammonia-lyase [Oceanospirillaceae bacterium]
MTQALLAGKPFSQWLQSHPLLGQLRLQKPVFWHNAHPRASSDDAGSIGMQDILEASDRLSRFAPYIAKVFVETRPSQGIIESPLREISSMQRLLAQRSGQTLAGKLLLKCDNDLPISGSVKARGGIYEILKHAEQIALAAGLLTLNDNYALLDSPAHKALFAQHSIAVGSTGNLGLSIGIMSAQLGFKVTVHMSADAKQWKKALLRSKGVTVVEYLDDYSQAVTQGRIEALATVNCHFVDDENSIDLFMGYAVAALRLTEQLTSQGVLVDAQHPLAVYLPCGVGGAPGGIAFGLKQVFGDTVHCFFAEPTAAPCMILGLYTGLQDQICVQDIGIDGRTCADGLAVGRASGFVGAVVQPIISGAYTLQDKEMLALLALLKDSESIELEPSALAGLNGIVELHRASYWQDAGINEQNVTHIAWATGGSMVPLDERARYYAQGCAQLLKS